MCKYSTMLSGRREVNHSHLLKPSNARNRMQLSKMVFPKRQNRPANMPRLTRSVHNMARNINYQRTHRTNAVQPPRMPPPPPRPSFEPPRRNVPPPPPRPSFAPVAREYQLPRPSHIPRPSNFPNLEVSVRNRAKNLNQRLLHGGTQRQVNVTNGMKNARNAQEKLRAITNAQMQIKEQIMQMKAQKTQNAANLQNAKMKKNTNLKTAVANINARHNPKIQELETKIKSTNTNISTLQKQMMNLGTSKNYKNAKAAMKKSLHENAPKRSLFGRFMRR